MKTKLFLIVVTALLILRSCSKSSPSTQAPTAPSATAPVINVTTAVSAITATSATSGGIVTSDGGASVTARGVCWNTSSNPTIANSKTVDGTGTGSFTSNLTGLIPGTVYHVRAYATNSVGTAYAAELSFTTLPLVSIPTLAATTMASGITAFAAISGGSVTNDGGAAVTARGVCWSTSSNPTITNFKTTNGTGTGAFVSDLYSLTPNTVYYVRAYATNSSGTGYGSEISFTSLTQGTVALCSKVWMTNNLTVTTYSNGDPIPLVTNSATWASLTTGAYCYYNNDPSTEATYGKLYNWYAVSDPRGLAPAGWHVPNSTEWDALAICLGGPSVAGGAMKESGLSHWASPNLGATNSSGFTALPGGYRQDMGNFEWIGYYARWWGTSEFNPTYGLGGAVWFDNATFNAIGADKRQGFNVRCVKD